MAIYIAHVDITSETVVVDKLRNPASYTLVRTPADRTVAVGTNRDKTVRALRKVSWAARRCKSVRVIDRTGRTE